MAKPRFGRVSFRLFTAWTTAALVLVSIHAGPAEANPTLKESRSAAPWGSSFSLTGLGFGSGTKAVCDLGERQVAVFPIHGGRFAGSVQVPWVSLPGRERLECRSGSVHAFAYLEVLPRYTALDITVPGSSETTVLGLNNSGQATKGTTRSTHSCGATSACTTSTAGSSGRSPAPSRWRPTSPGGGRSVRGAPAPPHRGATRSCCLRTDPFRRRPSAPAVASRPPQPPCTSAAWRSGSTCPRTRAR